MQNDSKSHNSSHRGGLVFESFITFCYSTRLLCLRTKKKNSLNLDFLHKPSQTRRKVLMRAVVWRIPLLVPAEASGLWQRNISGEESRKGRRRRLARLQPAFIYPRISATRWGLRVILVWRFHKGSRPGDVDTALRGCQRRGTYCPSLTALAGCGERGMKGRSVHGI